MKPRLLPANQRLNNNRSSSNQQGNQALAHRARGQGQQAQLQGRPTQFGGQQHQQLMQEPGRLLQGAQVQEEQPSPLQVTPPGSRTGLQTHQGPQEGPPGQGRVRVRQARAWARGKGGRQATARQRRQGLVGKASRSSPRQKPERQLRPSLPVPASCLSSQPQAAAVGRGAVLQRQVRGPGGTRGAGAAMEAQAPGGQLLKGCYPTRALQIWVPLHSRAVPGGPRPFGRAGSRSAGGMRRGRSGRRPGRSWRLRSTRMVRAAGARVGCDPDTSSGGLGGGKDVACCLVSGL